MGLVAVYFCGLCDMPCVLEEHEVPLINGDVKICTMCASAIHAIAIIQHFFSGILGDR